MNDAARRAKIEAVKEEVRRRLARPEPKRDPNFIEPRYDDVFYGGIDWSEVTAVESRATVTP